MRSPLAGRLTRYTLGSMVAATVSAIVFAAMYAAAIGTTACSITAFVAGAIPNWVLNRHWAWRRRGRIRVRKEVLGYAATSGATLLIASLATAWMKTEAQSLDVAHGVRIILVTGAYMAVFALMFLAKFAIYELWVFADPGHRRQPLPPPRRLRRSRDHVASTTRANRVP
jgi:putative flippase GtrA